MKVQSIYTSKILQKGLKFAAERNALFVASTSLVLSTIARPIAIMSTPNTDKENKKYACAKSLASSAIGYGLMLAASLPVSNAIKKINDTPSKYLKANTIKNLKAGEQILSHSKQFSFATKLFDLGLGFIIAVPKSLLTCALIPPFMSKLFPKKEQQKEDISFTGNLSKGIGKMIDSDFVQKLAKKYHNTKYEQHLMCLTDTMATGSFIVQTHKSKKIEQDRKKALMYNAGISTGLCIAGSYAIDKALEKPTKKFIENFKQANKNLPNLENYVKGINVAKPALILGSIYYIVIPIISTFLADRFDNRNTHNI